MGKEIQKVNAERKRQRYSKEFKLAAVKLLQAGRTAQAAETLNALVW